MVFLVTGSPHAAQTGTFSTAPPAAPKAILVLHTYGQGLPFRSQFDVNLVKTFRETTDIKVDLYVETLDRDRFADDAQTQRTRAYLRERYRDKNLAVVVAVLDSALAFVTDRREPLFPGVPVAALVTGQAQPSPSGAAIIWSGNQFGDTVALATGLHPSARQVVLVDGALSSSDVVANEASSQFAAMNLRLPVTNLRDLPLDELLARVQALPPESIIVFARQYIGRHGEPIANADALPEVARVARAPIYIVSDQMFGLGAVGGVVLTWEGQAEQLARLAIRLAKDGSQHIPPAEGAHVPMFDWRQLRRWNIDERLLPPNSEVRFRQLTVWDNYRGYIVATVTLIVTQTALIASLLFNRTRRRTAEVALRASGERARTLAGRLIEAQEDERIRIARELHDDLSQKLALLSVSIGQLLRDAAGSPGVARHAQAAADSAADLITSVRSLSHELHPARLEILGLEPALRGLCEEMSIGHDMSIEFIDATLPSSIPNDVALCLFRVAQEALSNVVKHSAAADARVSLRHADGMLALAIVDMGRGFLPGPGSDGGLGLLSMRERVQFLGGAISVQSSPGQGTRVEARVPV